MSNFPPAPPPPPMPAPPYRPQLQPIAPARPRRRRGRNAVYLGVALAGVVVAAVLATKVLGAGDAGPAPTSQDVAAAFVPLGEGLEWGAVPLAKLPTLQDVNSNPDYPRIYAFEWRYVVLNGKNIGLVAVDSRDPDDLERVRASMIEGMGLAPGSFAGADVLRGGNTNITYLDDSGLMFIITIYDAARLEQVAGALIRAQL